ncbi:alcohol dehydrogenase [Rhodocollybia butyracea]|uniref:Alcohol dehydrogenase n=1 Tax=Rhodocollybia butyracea TaxID=206335 RepID=A0A9P5TWP5_9AGAR|nr:alcohol dehydrogenase [Rhodocollybia butyracea]
MSHFTRIVLNERPTGDIDSKTFRSEKIRYSSLKVADDQVLVQVTWLSLDPAMRGWLRDQRSYVPPVQIGETMRAGGLGIVIDKGKNVKLKVGQLVYGSFGWTEYAVVQEKDAESIDVAQGLLDIDYLNNLGMAGLTAYFGLKEIGNIKAGETLVVSGAAGAVGSMACQLGLQAGAKVYAIAGSQDKCEWLEKEIGVSKAFNYKSPTFQKDFKNIGYLDVFFDNVGGDILDMCLGRLNQNARVVLCGAISAYNSVGKPKGLQGYLSLISQRAKIEGFVVFDYAKRFHEAIAEMSKGLQDGTIKRKFHIVEGLENAPSALPLLFSGGNTGKLVVKVAEPTKTKL